MFSGNWFKRLKAEPSIFLVASLLAFLVGVWALADGLDKDSSFQREADASSREFAAHTNDQIRQVCSSLPPPAKGACVAEKKHDYREDHRLEQELVAQRKAANWALIMGVAAVFGAVFSTIGVILVWITFRATKEANSITREIGEAQVRAYVSVSSSKLHLSAGLPVVEVSLQNSGQSPATEVIFTICQAVMTAADFSNPTEILPAQVEFGQSKSQPATLAAGEEDGAMVVLQPHPTREYDYENVPKSLLDKTLLRFLTVHFLLTWYDVFGSKCDATGTISFDRFQPFFPENGVIETQDGRVTNAVFDTSAWFARNGHPNTQRKH